MVSSFQIGVRRFQIETTRDTRREASEFLREARRSAEGMRMLRREYARLFPGVRIDDLGDDELGKRLEVAVARRQIRFFAMDPPALSTRRRARSIDLPPLPPLNPEPRQPQTPRSPRKTAITFQVLDENSGRPYRGVRLSFKHPAIGLKAVVTDEKGIASIDELDENTGAVTSDIEGAFLGETLSYVGLEVRSQIVEPPDVADEPDVVKTETTETRIARITTHKVRTGDSLDGLAKAHDLDFRDLAFFNWQTDQPSQINEHLRDDVGCTAKPDGVNYSFRDTDEPGLIHIPELWSFDGLETDKVYVFRVRCLRPKKHVHVLEMSDLNFNTASAVFLPNSPEAEEDHETPQVTGLDVLATLFSFVERHPEKRLLVAGHTDSVGSGGSNLELSEDRAANIVRYLKGERGGWAQSSQENHRVEDYQRILSWIANRTTIPCHPGPIDGDVGKLTRSALDAFRQHKKLPTGGSIKKEDWAAFFDVYDQELGLLLDADADLLANLRSRLTLLMPESLGCGENWPIEAVGLDGVDSLENRRVDLLLFDPGEEPDAIAEKVPGQSIYEKERYRAEPIPVTPTTEFDFQVWIRPTDDQVRRAFRGQPYRLEGPLPSTSILREGKTDALGDLLETHLPAGHYCLHIAGKDVAVAARWFDRRTPEELRAWPDVVRLPLSAEDIDSMDKIDCDEPGIAIPDHLRPQRPDPSDPEPILDEEPAELDDIVFDDEFTEEMLFASD